MAERRRQASDAELERALARLGSRLAYPATPDLARSVRARLLARPAPPRPSWATFLPLERRLALAALALLLALAGTLALFPEARTAVADRLGLRGVVITHVTLVPTPTPTATPAPTPEPTATPVPFGVRLSLGERVTLAEARERVGFQILTPSLAELGAPDEVYVGVPPPGGQVSLVYRARTGLPEAAETGVGLLLAEFRGDLDPDFILKGLGPGTRLEHVSVGGANGYWIEGKPHLFLYRDADGRVRDETVRLAGNTLLWQRGDIVLRLESALSRDEALRIAASVR